MISLLSVEESNLQGGSKGSAMAKGQWKIETNYCFGNWKDSFLIFDSDSGAL